MMQIRDGWYVGRIVFSSSHQTANSVQQCWGTEGNGPLQFAYPTGVALNSTNNKLYIGDSSNHRIQVLNSDLTFSSTFGKKGSGKEQFNAPQGVTCDSTGKVYVGDYSNHRIQVFTAEGKFLRMFGRHGQGEGEIDCSYGVAVAR